MSDRFDDELLRGLRSMTPSRVEDPDAVLDDLRPRMRRARNRRVAVVGVGVSILIAVAVTAVALAVNGPGGDSADEVTVAGDPTVGPPTGVDDGGTDSGRPDDEGVIFEAGPSAVPDDAGLARFDISVASITVGVTGDRLSFVLVDPIAGWAHTVLVDDARVIEVGLTDGSETLRWRAELRTGQVTTASGTVGPEGVEDGPPSGADTDDGSAPPAATPTSVPRATPAVPTTPTSPPATPTPSPSPTASPTGTSGPDDDDEPDEPEDDDSEDDDELSDDAEGAEDDDELSDDAEEAEDDESPEPEEDEFEEPEDDDLELSDD